MARKSYFQPSIQYGTVIDAMVEYHRVWCSQTEQPVLNRRADFALVTKTCNKVMLVFYLGLPCTLRI